MSRHLNFIVFPSERGSKHFNLKKLFVYCPFTFFRNYDIIIIEKGEREMWFTKVNGEYIGMYETKSQAIEAAWAIKSVILMTTDEDREVKVCKGKVVEVEE